MGKHTLIEAAVLLLLCSSCVGLVWADCDTSSEIVELNPCLSVTFGSDAAPSQSCCAAIKSLVAEGPCLCELLAYAETTTLPFNLTSLLSTVPAICNVDTPKAGCSASSTAGSPSSSPLPFMLPFPLPSGLVPAPFSSVLPTSGASRKIPGTILSILRFVAAPALLSLVLRAY